MFDDLRPLIAADLRRHPRVIQQGFWGDAAAAKRLIDDLPAFPKWKQSYAGLMAILDWDHRLPSRSITLRLNAYYSKQAHARAENEYVERCDAIAARNLYPEFDVADFAELPADESYEIDLLPGGSILECRFTAPWRRDVNARDAAAALAMMEASPQFAKVAADAGPRPSYLGKPEAVAWAPPCETGYGSWTVDVWYLLSFDMGMGLGKSFLCDLATGNVVLVREFNAQFT